MTTKIMRSTLSQGSSSSSSSSSQTSAKETHGSSSPAMFDRLSKLEAIVTKWDTDGSDFAKITSLFHESREEARRFLLAVSDINHLMHYFMTATVSSASPASTARYDLVFAHRLMASAVKRLQKEFFQILSANRAGLDTDSLTSTPATLSDAEVAKHDGESVREVECPPSAAMVQLRSIANCMVSAGYAKECVEIYRDIRKSIIDEGIYRLGFRSLSRSQIKRLDPENVEQRIKNWLAAARVVIETVFSGERALCDYVFGSSEHINESCFTEITRDAAIQFLGFPELIATNASKMTKRKLSKSHLHSAEMIMYHLLDLHNGITDLRPEIETVFSYNATSAVRSQALSSLQKLGASVQTMLADFEVAIQKDADKGPAIPGGGLHPLTRHVMNDLVLLADYMPALTDIFVDQPLPNNNPPSSSSVSATFAWLVLVLLCKLDGKAELYKDKALSYLFLANNLHYIVKKVLTTRNLRELLGEEWVRKHKKKAMSFGSNYKRLRWAKVAAALEEETVECSTRISK